ncbi:hypothetical protein [Rhodococcus sp. NPDC058521]|uniref:hypothetical protein n=1 Tax=Rhodococcus sp. NPDC058521 TaxID=3346536 RepID=UPI003648FA4E
MVARRASAPIFAALAAIIMCVPTASAAPHWGPATPPNPYLGPVGTATMHGDAASSDVTPLPGPGAQAHSVDARPLAAACPTLLEGSDELVVALCTPIIGRTPTVHLLDPKSPALLGGSLAHLELAKGSLLGGVYAYLDNDDRLVAVDGERKLQRISHSRDAEGRWSLHVDETVNLAGAIAEGDNVTGLSPDWDGNVWFATAAGVVGAVDQSGQVRSRTLESGEQVQNSISTSPAGTAVATTHALYQLRLVGGRIEVDWRQAYDRGPARKPGQLSWGTGSTPTYFGPATGSDYLAVVDNADPTVSLRVFDTSSGRDMCTIPVLDGGERPNGSENSPIGIGDSVYVASTYGYPYPATPDGAGPSVPDSAPFGGGLTRVDIDPVGCHQVWNSPIRSAAVPHLSTGDGNLYTVVRSGPESTTPLDTFTFTVLNPADGRVVAATPLPGTVANDTLQMSGTITKAGSYLQGTITGMLQIQSK